jgi:hypothetical protein
LKIIAATNAGARENFQAAIKEIDFIRFGRTAMGQAGEIRERGLGVVRQAGCLVWAEWVAWEWAAWAARPLVALAGVPAPTHMVRVERRTWGAGSLQLPR